ncbi:hypothetical protein [Photobacterium leiognathi]|uniref:hypothetical protein n=1 Tax=Photobacterium leiognathi TaxID=553611 RepID=UPI002982B4F4|nr:hypothetical protein [Photobacterium leiognathi]
MYMQPIKIDTTSIRKSKTTSISYNQIKKLNQFLFEHLKGKVNISFCQLFDHLLAMTSFKEVSNFENKYRINTFDHDDKIIKIDIDRLKYFLNCIFGNDRISSLLESFLYKNGILNTNLALTKTSFISCDLNNLSTIKVIKGRNCNGKSYLGNIFLNYQELKK